MARAHEAENERDKERPRRRPHSGEVGTALSLGSDAPESRMDGSNFRCGARRGAFVRKVGPKHRSREKELVQLKRNYATLRGTPQRMDGSGAGDQARPITAVVSDSVV